MDQRIQHNDLRSFLWLAPGSVVDSRVRSRSAKASNVSDENHLQSRANCNAVWFVLFGMCTSGRIAAGREHAHIITSRADKSKRPEHLAGERAADIHFR